MSNENLKVTINGLQFRNPTILAAGIMDQTGSALKRIWESGAGGVVTKSVGKQAKKGYHGPNVVQTPCGLLNAMGLPNPGIEEMIEEIEKVENDEAMVIGSIFGENREEFEEMARKMEKAEFDAIELNLSCPHAEDLSTIGHDPKLTEDIAEISQDIQTPTWVKLPGNTHIPNLLEVAEATENAGADALVITNTLPAMAIDVGTERPILGNQVGGLSGRAIRPIGIRLVYEVYKNVEIPIIGVGGVSSGEEMIEYVLAGAKAVEIGTGIMDRGLDIFKKVCDEAQDILDGRRIEELRGKAHQN